MGQTTSSGSHLGSHGEPSSCPCCSFLPLCSSIDCTAEAICQLPAPDALCTSPAGLAAGQAARPSWSWLLRAHTWDSSSMHSSHRLGTLDFPQLPHFSAHRKLLCSSFA